MRTAGIICEYNPFHMGHQYQIRKTREILGQDTAIVCLMSGNYVQRGEPAIYDKWLRAEAALLGGADLVLELPITAAVNAAGFFAHRAVEYLDALGCVDYLSFGSECGDSALLRDTAQGLDHPEFEKQLRKALSEGVSYAAARTKALEEVGGDPQMLTSPNNSLGVEYLRGLSAIHSTMVPVTVQRDLSLPAASQLRRRVMDSQWQNHVPNSGLYEKGMVHTLLQGERAMLGVLRTLPDEAFREMAFESEGIWSKVMKACRTEAGVDEIIMACKSKRYAYSRLRRTLLCLFLGLDREKMNTKSPYLRVLGFNETGRQVLRQAGKHGTIPLVSGVVPNTSEAKAYFALEQRAADLYGLFAPEQVREPWGREKGHRPVIL